MAIAVLLEWPTVTQAQYDAAMAKILVRGGPTGGIFHVAGPIPEGGWRIVDVWESQEAYDTFVQVKAGPIAKELGIPPPQVTKVWPVHNTLELQPR